MQVLQIATAATIIVGPVLDSGGLAVTNAVIGDFRLTAGGTTSTLASPATATHSHNGHYTVALSTANTSAIGLLTISSGNSNHAMPPARFQVVNLATYHAYFTQFENFASVISAEIAGSIETDDNNWDVAVAVIAGRSADSVWNSLTSSHTTNNTFGQRVLRSTNSNSTVAVTGSNHVAADIHTIQTGAIVDSDFAAGSIYEKLGTLIEADPVSGFRYTTQALEQAPSGGGGVVNANIVSANGHPVLVGDLNFAVSAGGKMVNNVLEIVPGDKYDADDDTAITFTDSRFPDLDLFTSAELTVYVAGVQVVDHISTLLLDEATKTISVELTQAQTNLLLDYVGEDATFDLELVRADSTRKTIARGPANILDPL
jgi:hypothetical protein